jgi:hypothetical protein
MSHTSETRTFTAPAKSIPAVMSNVEQYERLARVAGETACKRTDKLHNIFGSTRSGWAIYTLKNILESFDLPALAFLTDSGQRYILEGEYGNMNIEVLDAAQQREVIAQLTTLLTALKAKPEAVYEAEEFGHLSEGDVEDALARDYISGHPYSDSQVRGDEGDTADYLFVDLRSVLALVENAQAEGMVVVHSLEE